MLGNFSFFFCQLTFSKLTFSKTSFRSTIRVSNRLDQDQDRRSVGPVLDHTVANVISRRQKLPPAGKELDSRSSCTHCFGGSTSPAGACGSFAQQSFQIQSKRNAKIRNRYNQVPHLT